jgi:hypothetical protein
LQHELHDLSGDDFHWRRLNAFDGAMQRHGMGASLKRGALAPKTHSAAASSGSPCDCALKSGLIS